MLEEDKQIIHQLILNRNSKSYAKRMQEHKDKKTNLNKILKNTCNQEIREGQRTFKYDNPFN